MHQDHKRAVEDVAYAVDEEKRRQRERLRQRLKEKKRSRTHMRAQQSTDSPAGSDVSVPEDSEGAAPGSTAAAGQTKQTPSTKKTKKPPPPLPPGKRPSDGGAAAAASPGGDAARDEAKRAESLLHAWEEVEDPGGGGDVYYHNRETGATQWEMPPGLSEVLLGQERDFMRRMYELRGAEGSEVTVSAMMCGWQTVIVSPTAAATGCAGADGGGAEAMVFFHRVSTGRNQWEQPAEILSHKTEKLEKEAEVTWSGDRSPLIISALRALGIRCQSRAASHTNDHGDT